MKSILATFCCAAALSAQAALLPQPREYKSLDTDIKVPEIQLMSGVSSLAGNSEFREAFSRIAGVEDEIGGVPVRLVFDGSLPKNGYRITPEISSTGEASFNIAAADRRGFYYAAATLNQLTKTTAAGKTVAAAVVTDYPEWTERYVSDVPESITFDRLLELTANKISGICLRTEGNWQSEEWMEKQAEVLKTVKRATGIDAVDVMFQMHLSPRPPMRKMNFADEKDIQLIIDRARVFAENGASAIMLAVDDLTPQEDLLFTYATEAEKARFGLNAGRGHGYVTRRVYEALNPDFPNLKLSMVVAPYAFIPHGVALKDGADYYRQWSAEAPVETQLVWTGINVFSPDVTADQQSAVHKLLERGQKTFVFDNSNGVAAPLPVWNGSRFSGMAAQDEGRTLLWGSWYLRPLERLYYLTANDYLWNPSAYRADESYRRAAENQFGPAAAEPMLRLQQTFQAAEAELSTTDRSKFHLFLGDFKKAFKEAEKVLDRNGKTLPLAQLAPRLKAFEEFLNEPRSAVKVNKSEPGVIVMLDRAKPDDPAPATAEISAEADGLHIVFNVPNPDVPERAEIKHDDKVYLSPDCIEMFIQPVDRKAEWLNSEPPSTGYAHLVFDSSANRYDENGVSSPLFYNPEWTVSTENTADGWRADVFVPYSAFEPMAPFYTKPGEDVRWKANFHRVNNVTGKVQSWSRGGDKFHAPEHFGEFWWDGNVLCDGVYPLHLQGVARGEDGSLFWSYTDRIVKTTPDGRVLKTVILDGDGHLGDLACRDGLVAGPVADIRDYSREALGTTVFAFRQSDLEKVAEYKLENAGYDGIVATDRGFAIAKMPSAPEGQTSTIIVEYTPDFKTILGEHVVTTPPIYSGIQNLARFNDGYIASCYGSQFYLLDKDFNVVKRLGLNAGCGVLDSEGDTAAVAGHRTFRPNWQAYIKSVNVNELPLAEEHPAVE